MAIRLAKEADTSKLFSLRIGNIPDEIKYNIIISMIFNT